jgi:signal transduction histidine kinase/membrane protein implicated in regulation of membrane protease activity
MALGLFHPRGLASEEHDDFSVDRLRWIIRLRWFALGGILLAATVSGLGFFPGVNWKVLLATVAVAGVYNLVLWRRQRRRQTSGAPEAVRQAIVDMGLLTLVLWAAGGRTPFIGYYVFHVAIVGILGGKRATVVAAVAALVGSMLLLVTEHVPALQIGRWDPLWPWDLLAEVAAFVTTVGAVAYLVTHAVHELRLRERALAEARDRSALELEVLSNTLDELDAGLEIVERDGAVLWRNKRAEELAPFANEADAHAHHWSCPGELRSCERDTTGLCPVKEALDRGQSGHCRFAARIDGQERIYEMNVFPLDAGPHERPRIMNLYVDRTSGLVAERRLMLAERLASLGRVTQGVAHELNTPLATIRTLAADMIAALRAVEGGHGERQSLLDDLRESAALVHDETRRLGRITQGLLTGRDLTASEIDGSVPLAAVVERARALVFAGARKNIPVEIGADLSHHAVIADPDHLVQVMVNLLQNAYDAVRERSGGAVRVHARSNGDRVDIVIDDDGPGIPEAVSARLFEPFATTKPPGQGTGLGLYTSYMLVASMQGSLTLDDRPEGGARAVVSLPAAVREAPLVRLGTKRPRVEAAE